MDLQRFHFVFQKTYYHWTVPGYILMPLEVSVCIPTGMGFWYLSSDFDNISFHSSSDISLQNLINKAKFQTKPPISQYEPVLASQRHLTSENISFQITANKTSCVSRDCSAVTTEINGLVSLVKYIPVAETVGILLSCMSIKKNIIWLNFDKKLNCKTKGKGLNCLK